MRKQHNRLSPIRIKRHRMMSIYENYISPDFSKEIMV